MVDTLDLKFNSINEYQFKSGNKQNKIAKMMELVYMLGLGSNF